MKLTTAAISRDLAKGFKLSLFACSLLLSSQVSAENVLCDAKQASTDQLPQLEQSCPIGKGVWGSKAPSRHSQSNLFWIQCGLLGKPISVAGSKPLYDNISTNVWMKPESKGYRCLIGPYNSFADARNELAQVRKVKGYNEAFIRMVEKSKPASVAAQQSAEKSNVQSKPAVPPKPSVQPKPMEPAATIPAAVVSKPQTVTTPAIQAFPDTEQSAAKSDVEIRLSAKVAGKQYSVPFLLDGQQQFYMEQGKPWTRLDYDAAKSVCNNLNMRMMTEEEWQRLLGSKVMEQQRWPMHLPYWGSLKKGLFTNGNVTQLKGSSLLNVMCVK